MAAEAAGAVTAAAGAGVAAAGAVIAVAEVMVTLGAVTAAPGTATAAAGVVAVVGGFGRVLVQWPANAALRQARRQCQARQPSDCRKTTQPWTKPPKTPCIPSF